MSAPTQLSSHFQLYFFFTLHISEKLNLNLFRVRRRRWRKKMQMLNLSQEFLSLLLFSPLALGLLPALRTNLFDLWYIFSLLLGLFKKWISRFLFNFLQTDPNTDMEYDANINWITKLKTTNMYWLKKILLQDWDLRSLSCSSCLFLHCFVCSVVSTKTRIYFFSWLLQVSGSSFYLFHLKCGILNFLFTFHLISFPLYSSVFKKPWGFLWFPRVAALCLSNVPAWEQNTEKDNMAASLSREWEDVPRAEARPRVCSLSSLSITGGPARACRPWLWLSKMQKNDFKTEI